jgi:hypothetical protein
MVAHEAVDVTRSQLPLKAPRRRNGESGVNLKEHDQKLAETYGTILAEHEDLDVAKMRAASIEGRKYSHAAIHEVVDNAIVSMNTLLESKFPGPNGHLGLRKLIALAIVYVFNGTLTTTAYNTAKGRVSRVLLSKVGKVREQGQWGSSPRGSGRIKKE